MDKANRHHIFCHMETSLDGKIMGKYLWIEETNAEEDSFYTLFSGPKAYFKPQALLNGRTTVEDNFTFYKTPDVDESAAPVPAGDFLADDGKTGFYLIVTDSKGRVAWEEGQLTDFYGHEKAQVVEVLSEQATNAYKAYLRKKGVSYLICGKDSIDLELTCRKLKDVLQLDSVMLGGGGAINWSFLQQGLCDEVSVVIAPAADGSADTQTLFMARPGFSDDQPVVFSVKDCKVMADGKVWLRYDVQGKSQHDFAADSEYQAVQDMLAKVGNP